MRKPKIRLMSSVLFPVMILAGTESRAQNAQDAVQITASVAAEAAAQTIGQPAQGDQTGSCAMRVHTARSVTGVTTKSGFAKFALGTLLPAIAGSAAGSAAGPGGFRAGRDLATQSSITANRAMANRTSDVPPAIAGKFSAEGQASAIRTVLGSLAGSLASSSPVFDVGLVPENGLDAARFGLTERQCVRVLTIDSISFEHSKDYKARNAIVILSNLVEYGDGKKKALIRVADESRSAITPFDVDKETVTPALQAELDKSFDDAITQLLGRFSKKRK